MKLLICCFAIICFATLATSSSSKTDIFECPQPNGYFVHPDRHHFYRCIRGTIYVYNCGDKLVWNQRRGRCDWHPSDPAYDREQPENPNDIILPREAHYRCPPQLADGFFPHPNVHRFFRCVNGIDFEYACPDDLVWNQSRQRCDYDSDDHHEDDKDNDNDKDKDKDKDDDDKNICVTHPDGFFPYHRDPHKYIRCVEGRRFVQQCPAGLVWNESSRTCAYAQAIIR